MTEERYPIEEVQRLSRGDPYEVGPALVALAKEVLEHRANATVTATQIAGYTAQSDAKVAKVAMVNEFKEDEERLLRKLDAMMAAVVQDGFEQLTGSEGTSAVYDKRWLAIARTHFQQGFMALNRAVFQPQRIRLPEDDE